MNKQRPQHAKYRKKNVADFETLLRPFDTNPRSDGAWLRTHRDIPCRLRLATPRELKAKGLPARTIVIAVRGANGMSILLFVPPKGRPPCLLVK